MYINLYVNNLVITAVVSFAGEAVVTHKLLGWKITYYKLKLCLLIGNYFNKPDHCIIVL